MFNDYGSIPINTIFSGMNIHKSQLFWGSLGTRVLTHCPMTIIFCSPVARQCFCGRQLAQLVQAKTELHVCEGHPQQLTVAPSVAQAADVATDVATDGDGRSGRRCPFGRRKNGSFLSEVIKCGGFRVVN